MRIILEENRNFHEFYKDWNRRSPVSGLEFLGFWIEKWRTAAADFRKEGDGQDHTLFQQHALSIEAVCDELISRLNDSDGQKNWELLAHQAIWNVAYEFYTATFSNINIERLIRIADCAGINLEVIYEEMQEHFQFVCYRPRGFTLALFRVSLVCFGMVGVGACTAMLGLLLGSFSTYFGYKTTFLFWVYFSLTALFLAFVFYNAFKERNKKNK